MILFPEFPDWVLFEEGAPLAVESLPVSLELRDALIQWYRQWSRLDEDYGFEMRSDAKIDWTKFDLAGIELWKRLRLELRDGFQIAFYSHTFRENFEDPDELSELLRSHLNA
jgi:hypothetical protein